MMMSPVLSINKAYSLLIDQESQRSLANFQEFMQVTKGIERTTLYSNKGNGGPSSYFMFKKNQI